MNTAFEQPSMASPVNKSTKKRPAKSVKKKDTSENAPIFLRKTYHMIDTCDPEIAGWSDGGETLVVKDLDSFEQVVIPQFFKHSKFSSFVRQLNFYGFRKIKSDPLRIKDAATDVESKYWKFRHEKFRRGRPDLLAEIKKSNHTEAAEKQEVDALKSEVKDLKSKLANMSSDIERLTGLVGNLVQNQQLQASKDVQFYLPEPDAKRRKVDLVPSPVKSSFPGEPVVPLPVTSLPDASTAADSDLFAEQPSELKHIQPAPPSGRSESYGLGTLDSTDEEILTSLFALDSGDAIEVLDTEVPDTPLSLSKPEVQKPESKEHQPDPALLKKLGDSLSTLPKEMQALFVERLVATIADPECFKKQVEAVTALALAAAHEAERRIVEQGGSTTAADSIPLATAVLGAFLTHYGSGTGTASPKPSTDFSSSAVPMIN